MELTTSDEQVFAPEVLVFQLVRVNGNLTIAQDGKDKHFRCKHLFIRGGEFHVGSKETPF
jgi:hypothetical protein